MMERRFFRAAAGSIAVFAVAALTACSATTHSTPSAAGGTTAPVTATSSAGSMKTLPPSRLCTALTTGAAKQLIADPRLQTRVSPNKGDAPDGCSYAAADGTSTLALTSASRTYDAELSAAHDLSANPASAGMRDVRVDPVSNLGRQAFRETSYQIQARQHITFVVWHSGAGTWVLTFATTADTSTPPTTASDDKLVQVARSITTKLPAGQ
ncbi:DUF3558 domain-containing protein [Streptomyces sp. NBC_01613]|uniref:hypothetical protein n=1 Tax=Streptomyces sp. NBC_01613 TaxID=2975896 RepID=UPI00386C5A8D